MNVLAPHDYQRIAAVVGMFQKHHGDALAAAPGANPLVRVDGLCFQPHADKALGDCLVGALLTPASLSLMLLPGDKGAINRATAPAEHHQLTLPSGVYRLERVVLDPHRVWYQRQLLDDLTGLDGMADAARLAQRLMESVMRPAATTSSSA